MSAPRGRFAPTPSGRMHLGNVYAALMAWLSIRAQNGELLLRMEDLDTARCSSENAEVLRDDLRWLGLVWDREVPAQSGRSGYYEEVLDALRRAGEVFPCWCTRGDLKNAPNAPHASDGHPIYPGTCRLLSPGERAARARLRAPLWRLHVPDKVVSFTDENYGLYQENLARDCGDFILRRADGIFAYQLAVVADDMAEDVTQVVRGRDLLSSTPRQLYLYELLLASPPAYAHIPLLTAPDGRRLSKRDRDLDMGLLRNRFTPEELLGILGHSAGLLPAPTACSLAELTSVFDLTRLGREDRAVSLPLT